MVSNQYKTLAPEGSKAGQFIRVIVEERGEFQVQVPQGVNAGEVFLWQLDDAAEPQSQITDSQKAPEWWTLLDQLPISEFCASIVVGIFMGVFIFLGFLAGIIYSTEAPSKPVPIQKEVPAYKEVVLQAGKQRKDEYAESPKLEL